MCGKKGVDAEVVSLKMGRNLNRIYKKNQNKKGNPGGRERAPCRLHCGPGALRREAPPSLMDSGMGRQMSGTPTDFLRGGILPANHLLQPSPEHEPENIIFSGRISALSVWDGNGPALCKRRKR